MVTFDICKGNPGALTFLMGAYGLDMFKAEEAFQRMQNMKITGDKLYMVWNDCCDRDTEFTLDVMIHATDEEIIRHLNYEHGRGIRFDKEKFNNWEYGRDRIAVTE